jgi:hypothetical protein
MKYDFRVGDYVEDVTGRVGYIQSICQCEQCKARGFYEPFVLYTDGNGDYITVTSMRKGFRVTNALDSILLPRQFKFPSQFKFQRSTN